MNVVEVLIPRDHPNRPGFAIAPRGAVVHRTGKDRGALWLAAYFGRDARAFDRRAWRYGSAHYGIDDALVARYIPEDEGAYHVGGDGPGRNRNGVDLGVELCQYLDDPPRIRPRTYAIAVAFSTDLCRRYRWAGPRELDAVGVARFTRHSDWDPTNRPEDPGAYLRWDDVLDDVERAIAGAPWIPREERDMTPDQEKKLDRLIEIGEALLAHELDNAELVWTARTQRSLDVERGEVFDPTVPPLDPRIDQRTRVPA